MPVLAALGLLAGAAAAAGTAGGGDTLALLQGEVRLHDQSEEELDVVSEDMYPVAGDLDWPFQAGQGVPDVYVHWVPSVKRDFEPWVYHPASFTIGQAFADLGACVKWTSDRDLEPILQNVSQAVAEGRQPVLFAIAFWSKKATPATRRFLAEFTEAGGYLVLYQSENMAWVGEKHLPLVESLAQAYGAKEIWEYSLASLEYYKNIGWNKLPIRYFPPGYVKELDLGIDLRSPKRNEDQIAFLGRFESREETMRKRYLEEVGDLLQTGAWVQTKSELEDYVTTYPLQLNNHHAQDCCPSHNAVESFRFAQLVANKACIISAECLPAEMEEWEGIVHFVDVAGTRQMVQEVQKDVQKCQTNSYALFKERFAPARLLNRTGFEEKFLRLAPHLRK